jgi:hypothetical protein
VQAQLLQKSKFIKFAFFLIADHESDRELIKSSSQNVTDYFTFIEKKLITETKSIISIIQTLAAARALDIKPTPQTQSFYTTTLEKLLKLLQVSSHLGFKEETQESRVRTIANTLSILAKITEED